MKALVLLCDRFRYTLSERLEFSEDAADGQSEVFVDCCVVLVTVEQDDRSRNAQRMASRIKKRVDKTSPSSVVVNAFAHLSNSIGTIDSARLLTLELRESLVESGIVVVHMLPFGWMKQLDMSVRGSRDAHAFINV